MIVFQEELRPQLIKWGKPHNTSRLVKDSELEAASNVRFPSLDESGSELLLKDDHVSSSCLIKN